MTQHEEVEAVEEGVSPVALSVVGGAVGTIVGARRGPAGAVIGGFVGGTTGYLAGAAVDPDVVDPATVEEPVSIDVADPKEADHGEEQTADDGE